MTSTSANPGIEGFDGWLSELFSDEEFAAVAEVLPNLPFGTLKWLREGLCDAGALWLLLKEDRQPTTVLAALQWLDDLVQLVTSLEASLAGGLADDTLKDLLSGSGAAEIAEALVPRLQRFATRLAIVRAAPPLSARRGRGGARHSGRPDERTLIHALHDLWQLLHQWHPSLIEPAHWSYEHASKLSGGSDKHHAPQLPFVRACMKALQRNDPDQRLLTLTDASLRKHFQRWQRDRINRARGQ